MYSSPASQVVLLGAKEMVSGERRSWWRVLSTYWGTKAADPNALIMNNAGVAGLALYFCFLAWIVYSK